MTPELLLAPFTDKGKEVSTGCFLELILELKTETGRAAWDKWGPDVWPVPAAPFLTVSGHWRVSDRRAVISAQPWRLYAWSQGFGFQSEMTGSGRSRGLWPERKAGWRWILRQSLSGVGGGRKDWGWRQEVSFALEEIWELLREQNGHLKRIAQGLDGGLGACNEDGLRILL